MLAPAIVAEIKRLLADEGLSQRTVVRRTGVSRGTVHAIARGKRPDHDPRDDPDDDGFQYPTGPTKRCPTCGGMVLMPCLLCRVRAIIESQRRGRYQSLGERELLFTGGEAFR